jgi:transposase-like protein
MPRAASCDTRSETERAIVTNTPGTQLGRPPKFTADVQQQIVRFVAEGNYLEVACRAAGVTPQLVRYYRKKWQDGDPSAAQFDDFFAALEKALAIAEVASVRDIRSGRPGWQGQAWFMERRYSKRWARKDKTAAPPPSTTTTYEVEYVDPDPPEDSAPEAP